MSPNHPLLRRFEKRLEVEGRNLEWTTFKNDFFCRPRGAKVEIIWCARDWAREARQYPMPRLRRKMGRLIENRLLWRYWPLEENRDLYFRSRYCVADVGKNGREVRINLENQFYSPNRLLTSTQELQLIIDSFGDKLDNAWFAMNQSIEERGWAVTRWRWGTRDELKNLIRAMGNMVRQPHHGYQLWIYWIKTDFTAEIFLDGPYSNSFGREPDVEIYRPFLNCLKTHFPIESDILPIYMAEGYEMEDLWPRVEISSSSPTAHEKLEALLTWRDFLRGKVPADEIDELLRPFQ